MCLNLEKIILHGYTLWTCCSNILRNFQILLENQSGVVTRLHFVNEAQMQKKYQFHVQNLLTLENTKKIQNALHGEPFFLLFLYLEPHVKSKNSFMD